VAITRRDLIKTTGSLGLGLAGIGSLPVLASPGTKTILILGGTGFIGPHTVRYAMERGLKVSIFTRGRSQAELPAGVERLTGDRNSDLSALENRHWDAVIDNNCRDYRWAQKSTQLLRDATDHYLFVSSISSYDLPDIDWDTAHQALSGAPLPVAAPVVKVPDNWKDGDKADYALMKVLSENIVLDTFSERATIVRPTLIVGPGDPTWRWSYWPVRLQAGGEVLAPGNPKHSVQIIDQRDLTEWHVRLIENQVTGIYNGAGPANFLSFENMLQQTGSATSGDYRLTWVDESFLRKHQIEPWSDMPAWVPGHAMTYVDVSQSIAAGLKFRPLPLTAKDTLAFESKQTASNAASGKFSLSRKKESEVLAAWHAES
jgi:2'-hydroxyisoflavone reductase